MVKVKITQIRSSIKKPSNQVKTLIALGLGKPHKTVEHELTPSIEGMIRTVKHLVSVEK